MVKITRKRLGIHDLMFNESPTPFTPNWPPGFKPSTTSLQRDMDGPSDTTMSEGPTSDETPKENPSKHC
jgi:hypothetical protein